MDTSHIDSSIGALTSALGDPTRRGIYLAVRESADPVATSDIARLFNIHPNVARHHLDRLTRDGYLAPSRRTPPSGPGKRAGRPAKYYEATEKAIELNAPIRRYDLLAELLVRVLERIDTNDVAAIAEQIGREYGEELAAGIGMPDEAGFDTAVRAVATAMTGVGFEVDAADPSVLLTSYCPFGSTAINHPEVVCSLDRGLVSGMMGALDQRCEPVMHPHTNSADACITEVAISVG